MIDRNGNQLSKGDIVRLYNEKRYIGVGTISHYCESTKDIHVVQLFPFGKTLTLFKKEKLELLKNSKI